MPTYQCSCGSRYRFADEYLGRRSRCKRCGREFTLEATSSRHDDEGPLQIQDEAADIGERHRPVAPASPAASRIESPGTGNFTVPRVIIEPPEYKRTYGADLLLTFCFLSKLDNLLRFLIMWFWVCLYVGLMAFLSFRLHFFGVIVLMIVYGAYCAFRFGVIEEAAAGSDELPDITPSADIVDSTFVPFFNWIGSWLIVLSPAIAYVIIRAISGSPVSFLGGMSGSTGLAAFLEAAIAAKEFVLLGSLLLGFVAWPIVALCVGLGGFSSLKRIDLVIETVLKTLPIYLFTVLVATAQLIIYLPERSTGTGLIVLVLFAGVGLYLEIIALRAVGLYYHHFKDKFAWSWD